MLEYYVKNSLVGIFLEIKIRYGLFNTEYLVYLGSLLVTVTRETEFWPVNGLANTVVFC